MPVIACQYTPLVDDAVYLGRLNLTAILAAGELPALVAALADQAGYTELRQRHLADMVRIFAPERGAVRPAGCEEAGLTVEEQNRWARAGQAVLVAKE